MLDKLELLITRNNINKEILEKNIYDTLLFTIFEIVCLMMKDDIVKKNILSKFHASKDYLNLVKKIVFEYTGCRISDTESEIMEEWFIAYFRKNNIRKKYDIVVRKKLILEQHNRCALCKKEIELSDSHLDHIIPWDFVGDELENNLQILCPNCNERKCRRVDFQLKMLIINKENA